MLRLPLAIRFADLVGLALYLLMLAAVAAAFGRAHAWAARTYDTPAALHDWNTWRRDVGDMNRAGPVSRREPKSAAPPMLVLLDGYYAICLAGALTLSSALYFFAWFMARGALLGAPPKVVLAGEEANGPGERAAAPGG